MKILIQLKVMQPFGEVNPFKMDIPNIETNWGCENRAEVCLKVLGYNWRSMLTY